MEICVFSISHALLSRVGLDCQIRSRSGLCSKPPDLRSVGEIALNPSLPQVNVNKVKSNVRYHVNSTCKL